MFLSFGCAVRNVEFLFPRPGIEHLPPALKVWHFNPWDLQGKSLCFVFYLCRPSLLRKSAPLGGFHRSPRAVRFGDL